MIHDMMTRTSRGTLRLYKEHNRYISALLMLGAAVFMYIACDLYVSPVEKNPLDRGALFFVPGCASAFAGIWFLLCFKTLVVDLERSEMRGIQGRPFRKSSRFQVRLEDVRVILEMRWTYPKGDTRRERYLPYSALMTISAQGRQLMSMESFRVAETRSIAEQLAEDAGTTLTRTDD